VRGRFSREISLPVPDAEARTKILSLMTKEMRLAPAVNLVELGRLTPGFVGADLRALAREAGMLAVTRIIHENPAFLCPKALATAVSEGFQSSSSEKNTNKMTVIGDPEAIGDTTKEATAAESPSLSQSVTIADVAVEMSDFLSAAKSVQPTAKREGFAVVPNVTWNDVGALAEVREELLHNVLEPIAHPERFRSLGLEVPAGVLFFGPPG
jgi:ribosome biogenesis ATPase